MSAIDLDYRCPACGGAVEHRALAVVLHDLAPGQLGAALVAGRRHAGKPAVAATEASEALEEIDARELEQARLIIAEKSLRKGLAKYGRI